MVDIETAPKMGFVWGLWNQNVGLNQLVKDTYILNWSAKWLDDEYIYSDALHYHDEWKKNPENDYHILNNLWEMLDKADIVVGHNGDRFDLPTINSRFLKHGIHPPSAYRTVDTLKIARREFKFTSNKLEFLAQYLGLGSKIDTGGFDLWRNIVMNNCKKSFDKMVQYCEHDTLLLESVYKALRPWDKKHPGSVMYQGHDENACNSCGSVNVTKNGSYATNTAVYQKHKCVDCGHNMRSRFKDKTRERDFKTILKSI